MLLVFSLVCIDTETSVLTFDKANSVFLCFTGLKGFGSCTAEDLLQIQLLNRNPLLDYSPVVHNESFKYLWSTTNSLSGHKQH